MRGGPASVVGNRYVNIGDTIIKQYWDFYKLYGSSMC